MTKLDKVSSIALIAILAGGLGWGASAFTYRNNNTVTAQLAPVATTVPANSSLPAESTVASVPVVAAVAGTTAVPAAKTLTAEAPKPVTESGRVARTTATRPRVVNERAYEAARENVRVNNPEASRSARYEPRYEPRKRGMSNKTKTAIAVGGGAAMGAVIGGIAKGGKGAAIGAIIGGGGGALYSWIKHKQNKPVF